jgi:GAF domain-containing protein
METPQAVENAVKAVLRMADNPLVIRVNRLVEEAVRLTASRIGYYAVLNEQGDSLTMLGWSMSAMASCAMVEQPIQYPVEKTGLWGDCIRERRPVITNDYQNCTKPTRKGYPHGHVHIVRHANIPVWNDTQIVGILGVGNKETDYTDEDIRMLCDFAQRVWTLCKV